MNYYNDNDKFCAKWLKDLIKAKLIPHGGVDDRSIKDISPKELEGYKQCHFFAGIGGWPYALELAGWPRDKEVWTGSCPCQPFSIAGKGQGIDDDRHLWPAFRWLISQCRPPTIFGEQVASPAGREWLSGVRADLEAMGYEVGAADLCSAGVGSPNIRQRFFWVANACEQNKRWWMEPQSRNDKKKDGKGPEYRLVGRGLPLPGGMGDAEGGKQQRIRKLEAGDGRYGTIGGSNPWDNSTTIQCRDGKHRRIPEPSILGMVDGISIYLVRGGGLNVRKILQILRQEPFGNEGLLSAAFLFSAVFWQIQTDASNIAKQWSEACSKAFQSFGMLKMWEEARLATASQGQQPSKQRSIKCGDTLQGMPQKYSRIRWDMGSWHCKNEYMRRVWEVFQGEGPQEQKEQDLLTRMPERLGFPLSDEKINGRVGKLRGAGNSINPWIAKEFIEAFMGGHPR